MVVICNLSKFFSVQEKKASSHESSLQGLIVSHDACNMKCTCFATFGNLTNSTYFDKMLNTPHRALPNALHSNLSMNGCSLFGSVWGW
jgi:hypothetical protein